MNCPRCIGALAKEEINGIRLERCPECKGMFLERGELDRVALPHSGDLEFSSLDEETFKHSDAHGPADCPRCESSTMKKVEFNIYTGIILDYCESCSGFWLDGRELSRINEEVRSLNEAAKDESPSGMLWFATFIWSLPR